MPPVALSAVDVVSPAIQRTKRILFQPFRFSLWVKLAIIGFLTGEMSSAGGFNFNVPFPQSSGSRSDQFVAPGFPGWERLSYLIPLILLLVLVGLAVMLLLMYLGSVLRFVLFDGVLTGRVQIREGFRRWRSQGTRFFLWQLAFQFIFLMTLAVFVGLPLLLAWRAGVFRSGATSLGVLFFGGFALFCVFAVIMIVGLTIYVLTKDFVVPMMALEGIGPIEGWRRLLPMLSGSRKSYAGYIGMKIVLTMAAGILLLIADIILVLTLLVPFVILGVLGYLAAHAAGAGWNVFTITAAIVAGVTFAAIVFFVILLAAVPVVVFFQSYVLQFFGSRYEQLRALVYPEPPAPPEVPPISPEPLPA